MFAHESRRVTLNHRVNLAYALKRSHEVRDPITKMMTDFPFAHIWAKERPNSTWTKIRSYIFHMINHGFYKKASTSARRTPIRKHTLYSPILRSVVGRPLEGKEPVLLSCFVGPTDSRDDRLLSGAPSYSYIPLDLAEGLTSIAWGSGDSERGISLSMFGTHEAGDGARG